MNDTSKFPIHSRQKSNQNQDCKQEFSHSCTYVLYFLFIQPNQTTIQNQRERLNQSNQDCFLSYIHVNESICSFLALLDCDCVRRREEKKEPKKWSCPPGKARRPAKFYK